MEFFVKVAVKPFKNSFCSIFMDYTSIIGRLVGKQTSELKNFKISTLIHGPKILH